MKASLKDMVLVPAGTYLRYSNPFKKFKVKSKKGNDLWINNLKGGYSILTEKVPERLKKKLEENPALKEKLKGRKVVEKKLEYIQNRVVPLKIGNVLSVRFGVPKLDYADPLEIDYVLKFPKEVLLEGKRTREIRTHFEYNAAYSEFMAGGYSWLFDAKDDPALLQTGEWSITIFNKGKKITTAKFLVVEPGKENEVDEATAHTLEGLVAHQVSVDAFYMDRYEVTRKQFLETMGYQPGMRGRKETNKRERENFPADSIQWEEARDYCQKVGKHLPTEAEWEWAARGGRKSSYPWGKHMVKGKANFCDSNCSGSHKASAWDDGFAKLAPVGTFSPNNYGLYEMTGNQSEWVSDWYDPDYYSNAPEKNPVGPQQGDRKVVRGGSYWSNVNGLRVSARASGSAGRGGAERTARISLWFITKGHARAARPCQVPERDSSAENS